MHYYNPNHDPISTVQLSPFAEEQWHRIDTYSPIYPNWTDMFTNTHQRTHRLASGKLNVIDQIDLQTLKLDDEILLNELHDIRRGSAIVKRIRKANDEMKVLDVDEQENHTASLTDDYQTASSFLCDSKISLKHSPAEPSFANQPYNNNRPVSSNKSVPFQVNSMNPAKKFPQIGFGSKLQPALVIQLRQSAIIRQNTLSSANDQRLSTPMSISTPRRTVSSAHSSRHYQQQQESQLRHEINSVDSHDDQLIEDTSPPVSRVRARSAHSSRSFMQLLKSKNDRIRQRQSTELRSILIKPWRQASLKHEVFDNAIPNSLDIMHKICGPSTPFERNLRQDYHKRLNLYRTGSLRT